MNLPLPVAKAPEIESAGELKPPEHGWIQTQEQLDLAAKAAAAFREITATSENGLWTRNSWRQIGPKSVCLFFDTNCTQGRYTGNVRAIAVDPANSSIVYIGADSGGIFKSTDGGSNWQPVADHHASSLFISSLAIDPADSQTVYAGTSLNVLKTSDGGVTWSELATLGRPVYSVAVSPVDRNVVLAATAMGIERSTEGGPNFRIAQRANGRIVFFAGTAGNAYASLAAAREPVIVSRDNGTSWTGASGSGAVALPPNGSYVTLAHARSNPLVLYAGSSSPVGGTAFAGLFKTIDGGVTWARIPAAPEFCEPLCFWFPSMAVHPRDPNFLVAGGLTTHRTLDGGTTWMRVDRTASTGEQLYVDKHAFTFSPDGSLLFAGHDGGVHVGTNLSSPVEISWRNLNQNLNLSQFYAGFDIDQDDPSVSVAGAQDTGVTIVTAGAARGLGATQGDCSNVFIDPLDKDKVYLACFGSPPIRRFTRSTQRLEPFSGPPGSSFMPPLVVDRLTPSRMYSGAQGLYQSVNRSTTLRLVSPGFASITAITVDPSNSQTVAVGTRTGQVWRTDNMAEGTVATWREVSRGLPARAGTTLEPDDRSVTRILVDQTNSSVMYAAYSGFRTAQRGNLGHVFQSVDGGANWTDISNNLPNAPVYDILQDPDQPDDIYIATESGVLASRAGSPWAAVGAGLPVLRTTGVRIHRKSRTLRISTYGRGLWEVALADLSTPVLSVKTTVPNDPLQKGQRDVPVLIEISNPVDSVRTSGQPVTVLLRESKGLTVTGISGPGWKCANAPAITCNREDPLLPGSSFPPLNAVVDLDPEPEGGEASATVAVSGGGARSEAVFRFVIPLLVPATFEVADIRNAATDQHGPLAPGELISINGSGLSGPVTIGGLTAEAVCSSSQTRMIVGVPRDIPISDTGMVTVEIAGVAKTMELASTSPGILNASRNADGLLTIYGTGGGRTGEQAPIHRILVNGREFEVLDVTPWEGLAGGVYRIRARVDLPAGVWSVVWVAGGKESPSVEIAGDPTEDSGPVLPVCAPPA